VTVKAFVEINVAAGRVKNVLAELRRKVKVVQQVCVVTGHCDILAIVELPDLDSFSQFLTEEVQSLDGVVRTESLVCMTNDSRKR
jgi:DNA-binding Lrp family transcriptional regulator